MVIKSEALNDIKQDFVPFANHITDMIIDEKKATSFPNLEKDGILVIPQKKWSQDLKEFLDYKNLSQFTKNASEEQQQELWQEVANKLAEQLEKNTLILLAG